ncbi:unnamed protein product [Linum trigynum]|uniref:Uncharacterized protein n=1 Tax=Linum trigynum TaxID=586398 RepID=A0AAV2F8U2_9ROSI
MAFNLQIFAIWVLIATVIVATDRCNAIREVPIENSAGVEVQSLKQYELCCENDLPCCKSSSFSYEKVQNPKWKYVLSAYIVRKQHDVAAATAQQNPTDGPELID